MNMLEHALAYARMGWRVFPCFSVTLDGKCMCGRANCTEKDIGKHPITKHGFLDASADEKVIMQWWRKSSANIGIATGKGSNLFVLDVDGEVGKQTLAQWTQENEPLPLTPLVQTGRGMQYFFQHVPGMSINADATAKIDYRGEGGYVIAPPSRHRNGNTYTWLVPMETPLAEAPAWLVQKLKEQKAKPTAKPTVATAKPSMVLHVEVEDLQSHAGAGEGERNATLCRLVGIALAVPGYRPGDVPVANRLEAGAVRGRSGWGVDPAAAPALGPGAANPRPG
ncbi:MAG: bifunctional DNA primase/polymerase, partial [Planctomycetia bacterium]|nr:bifunctional DNA primase/polymerase [Planctomycetia bacterium]